MTDVRARGYGVGSEVLAMASHAVALLEEGADFQPSLPDDVIDHVILELRRLQHNATLELALALGRVVVDHLYNGDPAAWRERGPKDGSFRQLARRLDASEVPGLSAAALHRAVAIWDLEQRIGVTRRPRLTASHVRAVIGLPETEQARLLQASEDRSWTVQRLEKEVASVRRQTAGNRGRPPLPAFVKTVHKLERMLADETDSFGDLDRIGDLDEEESARVTVAVRAMKERCEALLRALGGDEPR